MARERHWGLLKLGSPYELSKYRSINAARGELPFSEYARNKMLAMPLSPLDRAIHF
jgi:hypothetical protein